MSLVTKLSGVVNLKEDERKSFRYLFLLSLITGIGLSYYFVAVNTFLIQKASFSNLPYAYIISGLGGVLLIRAYQHRQRRTGITGSYRESIIAFFLVAIGVFLAFTKFGGDTQYAVYLAYLGFLFNMPFTIIFALGFSAICSRLYNLSQSKRLLALVGTGEIIASIIGYLTAPLISKIAGSPNYLLPLSAVCILPALVPIQMLAADHREKLSHIPEAKASLKKLDLGFFTNERFYLLIAVASVFSVAAIYFVDYSYLITVRLMADYSGLEIAAVVGFFFSIVKTGELVFSFLSGHILSTKGVKFSILLLPLLLSGCFLLALAGGWIFKTEPVFILSFIFLAKFAERVVRKSISVPAIRVLYQVTGSLRLRIEATIDGLLNQVATVVSGVLLLVFSAVLSQADPLLFLTIIAAGCFILFLVWSFFSLKLYENYREKIWAYLTEIRSLGGAEEEKKQSHTVQQGGVLSQHPAFADTLEKALKTVSHARKVKDLHPVEIYSPSALSDTDETLLYRKLISGYFSNNNFFFRLAVIRFFQSANKELSVKLLKELGEISDLLLRYELLSAFNTHGARPEVAEVFYFEDLCHKYSNELILALSAQNDLQNIEDTELQAGLKWYGDMITRVLFELLKVLYEPSAIQVIYDIITAEDHQDIESRLFALELLDNTLNDDLKRRLIPIFEPAPFDQKIKTLQQFVAVYPLTEEQQLKELLMKDFTLVNPKLKEACLKAYYRLSGDKKVLNAFNSSNIKNLQKKAEQLINNAEDDTGEHLLSEIGKAYALSSVQCSYLYNQAVQLPGAKKEKVSVKSHADNPYQVNIGSNMLLDVYALALFIDSNQSGA